MQRPPPQDVVVFPAVDGGQDAGVFSLFGDVLSRQGGVCRGAQLGDFRRGEQLWDVDESLLAKVVDEVPDGLSVRGGCG
jgi:hypothetical protein